ncbi:hypothetical protein BgAZ_304620 [Babesia gibsoni]|uniref:CWF21 domain-containing protein n=1 Tax=Babesia gibsoni TaxID=33632 RepID=A0AAD8LLD1_BABGI|nr:hypothetical protein BgAZ_304620 [Babesia gibsoni]
MFNGVGLSTPRGSGTNGYVQRSLATLPSVRISRNHDQSGIINRPKMRSNPEIAMHEKLRAIEVVIMEMRMKNEGKVSAEELEKMVTQERDRLMKLLEKDAMASNVKETESNRLAEQKLLKNKRMESALKLGPKRQDYVPKGPVGERHKSNGKRKEDYESSNSDASSVASSHSRYGRSSSRSRDSVDSRRRRRRSSHSSYSSDSRSYSSGSRSRSSYSRTDDSSYSRSRSRGRSYSSYSTYTSRSRTDSPHSSRSVSHSRRRRPRSYSSAESDVSKKGQLRRRDSHSSDSLRRDNRRSSSGSMYRHRKKYRARSPSSDVSERRYNRRRSDDRKRGGRSDSGEMRSRRYTKRSRSYSGSSARSLDRKDESKASLKSQIKDEASLEKLDKQPKHSRSLSPKEKVTKKPNYDDSYQSDSSMEQSDG